MTELAIYDMDRTITRTATFTPFLLHAAWRLAPWRLLLLPAAIGVMLAYLLRQIDRATLKQVNHRLLLGRQIDPRQLQPVVDSFAAATVRRNVLPGAIGQIADDRAAGRRLVLATASYRLYAEAIAARLGFDDVIATNSVIGLDARVSAKIDGENCYGPAKLRMIEQWFASERIERDTVRVRFYSDHASDEPVMAWADEPFAANPSRTMRMLAAQRGWPVVDWR